MANIFKSVENRGIRIGFVAGFLSAMSICAVVLIVSTYLEWKIIKLPLIADCIATVQ